MPDGVIATDGDGTLWTGDVGEDLFRAFVDQDLVRPAAVDALRRMASVHELSDAGTGQDVARRIYAAYVRGAFPEQRVCEVMTWCYAGLTVEEIRAFAQRVVEDANLPSRIQGEMRYLLDRARSAGIRVVLVSASPTYSVAEAAKRLGLLERDVVAARPRVVDAVIQPELELPIPYCARPSARPVPSSPPLETTRSTSRCSPRQGSGSPFAPNPVSARGPPKSAASWSSLRNRPHQARARSQRSRNACYRALGNGLRPH